MTSAWWPRNKTWLAVLIPLLALALTASAFRLTRIYLPWNYTRPAVAATNTVHFEQRFRGGTDTSLHRSVDITVDEAEVVPTFEGKIASPGGTLYRIDLTYSAAPDQILSGCTIEVVGPDGTRYGTGGGQTRDPAAEATWVLPDCVPKDTPGPTVDGFTDEIVPGDVERPQRWSRSVAVAMPNGVVPSQVRIGWHPPEYAVMQIPR